MNRYTNVRKNTVDTTDRVLKDVFKHKLETAYLLARLWALDNDNESGITKTIKIHPQDGNKHQLVIEGKKKMLKYRI